MLSTGLSVCGITHNVYARFRNNYLGVCVSNYSPNLSRNFSSFVIISPSWFVITLISVTSFLLTTLYTCVSPSVVSILSYHPSNASCVALVTAFFVSALAVVFVSFGHSLKTIVLVISLVCTSLGNHCVSFISLAFGIMNRNCRRRLLRTYSCLLDLCHLSSC